MERPEKTIVQGQPVIDALPAGTVIGGRYRLERVLGQGGMGVVYLAVHLTLKRAVALKMLLPHLAGRQEFVARFHREAEALAKLRHKHIVGVTDFGNDGGHYYLVFDYVEGGTLESHFLDRGHAQLAVAEVARLVSEILHGLEHAHRAGIVHRDLKPANILLEKTGDVKISDFGLARVIGDEAHQALIAQTQSSITMGSSGYAGTADFMAPEVKMLQPADARSDVYAVGVIAYWLLTGRRPSAMATAVSKAAKARKLGREWDSLIARALAEDPAQRFRSAAEMQAALRSATMAGNAPRRFGWAAALVATVAVAVFAWFGRARPLLPRANDAVDAGAAAKPSAPPASAARAVVLRNAPAASEISIDGGAFSPLSEASASVTIPSSGADVVVRAPGHQDWKGRIGGRDQPDIDLAMQPLRPHAVILAGLPSGAVVTVDAVEHTADAGGKVTLELVPGRVEVSARANRYLPFRRGFDLAEADTQLEVQMEREPPPREIGVPLAEGVLSQFRRAEPGEFVAGAQTGERGRQPSDEPAHVVRIDRAFYLGVYEVTQTEYVALMRSNPSASRSLRDGRRPVEQVGWAALFMPDGYLARVNARLRALDLPYVADLPTEQEWEYACRAGTATALNNGRDLSNPAADPALDRIAVYRQLGMAPEAVGSREPNAWGFYDMEGNVAEWTKGSPVLRGGNWRVGAAHCRTSSRVLVARDVRPNDTMGLRLVLRPTGE